MSYDISFRTLTPVSCRQSMSQCIGNCVLVNQIVHRNLGNISLNAPYKLFLKLLGKLDELLSKKLCKQSANKIKSFFTIMISVIFLGSSQGCIEHSVHHVAQKHCLFNIALLISSQMRKKLLL